MENLLEYKDILVKILKSKYPSFDECFIDKCDNPWGYSALAKIIIYLSNTDPMIAQVMQCGTSSCIDISLKEVIQSWINLIEDSKERQGKRVAIFKEELLKFSLKEGFLIHII